MTYEDSKKKEKNSIQMKQISVEMDAVSLSNLNQNRLKEGLLDCESFQKKNSLVEIEVCIICHDDINEGEMIIEIPKCRHFMHEECLLLWLKEKQSCPLCRLSIEIP